MSFELIDEMDCIKGDQIYTIRLYFDADTNTQKHEYLIDNELLYYFEYEIPQVEKPRKDIDIKAVVEGFEYWYSQVGPDWRPEPF